MTTTVAPTNGAAKKHIEAPKTESKNTSVNGTRPQNDVNSLTTVPATVIPIEKNKSELPALEDRFYKLDTLFALREKHEKLKDSLDKLNKFKLSSDGRSDNITLKDDKNNTFSTSNPDVLTKVVEWLKEDLTQKIKQVDSQIRF